MSEHQLRFLGLAVVSSITGLSKTSIYSGISDFPKPIKIKGAGSSKQSGSRWVESEVLAWMVSRIQLRDAQRDQAKADAAPRPFEFPHLPRKQDPAKAGRRADGREIVSRG